MSYAIVSKRGWNAVRVLTALVACNVLANTWAEDLAVRVSREGQLVYGQDESGNRIPDFSNCGYAGADLPIPDVPARVVVTPADGDDTRRIQAAIDAVAKLPRDKEGFRGSVQLAPGQFEVDGQLRISESGVVLRGSGGTENGTTIVATGFDRRPLIRIEGHADRRPLLAHPFRVQDEYVPVGSTSLKLDSVADLSIGDEVLVVRPSTVEWIKAAGMDAFGVGWRPGTRDIRWNRIIRQINGNSITLDAPITTAIEKRYGGATVEAITWPGRIDHIGVEDLRLRSQYDEQNPHDEEHSWFGVTLQNVQNAFVRRVEFRHFAGGSVALWENTRCVTVEDCISLEPISEVGGYRRHTLVTQGQLTLFLRCWSEQGRHDFAVGNCAAGPNAFVNCQAMSALDDSGPIESWSAGVLYDNVRIDGAGLDLENLWISPPGAGWSAANCVLWQCQAATMSVFRPPTANNWALGVWGGVIGDGSIQARSDFVNPLSLYQSQLAARRGANAAAHIGAGLRESFGATNPTLAQAAEFVKQSREPAPQLIDLIRANMQNAQARSVNDLRNVTPAQVKPASATSDDSKTKLGVKNGWLVIDGKLKTGRRIEQPFWRGTIRPDEAVAYGPAITRFMPGRVGAGFTDDLDQLTEQMQANGTAVFDHHYGLWYERRRDDHTMVRQGNGDVAPPFLEQPFARTGTGTAWNGLSKYDLTKFNHWYWQRLHDFARLCDDRGLILFHQNYFQHNILEAGAHWADSPWRPANNVDDAGFPEPPPYIGGKRIFMAPMFYDVSDPRRRALHRNFIRRCLGNFADCANVVQLTSAEYSGPLEFTQFWIDTILEWQHEHQRDVLVALSAPKDVQDAILADPRREAVVDVIDIRYWAYSAADGLYAPAGGQNLAPRQHLRQTKLKPGGAAAIVKAVREYRTRFPTKAVTYYAEENCPSISDGWAVLVGGGSLPNVKLPDELAIVIPSFLPTDQVATADRQWCIANNAGEFLIYTDQTGHDIECKPPKTGTRYLARWINPRTGEVDSSEQVTGGATVRLPARTNVLWLQPSKQ